MEMHSNRFLDVNNTIQFRKMKRLITNYEPLLYFTACLPALTLAIYSKFGVGAIYPHIVLTIGKFSNLK